MTADVQQRWHPSVAANNALLAAFLAVVGTASAAWVLLWVWVGDRLFNASEGLSPPGTFGLVERLYAAGASWRPIETLGFFGVVIVVWSVLACLTLAIFTFVTLTELFGAVADENGNRSRRKALEARTSAAGMAVLAAICVAQGWMFGGAFF